MKKMGTLILILSLFAGILTGCGDGQNQTTEEKYQIVCTNFSEYDWVREIVGTHADLFEIRYLLDNGTDIHNYQPTVEDIVTISNCDIFIYTGGESEDWVTDALNNSENEKIQVISLMEILADSLREEEVVEGMMDSHEHHEHHEHHEDEEAEYDEHVWLSLRNAEMVVEEIERVICLVDAEHAEDYQENSARYQEELQELDEAYVKVLDAAQKKTVLVADRFPFRYLAEDYGLNYYAAFSGCSAETEASFETITFLMKKVEELDINAVLVIENSDQSLAETVIANTKERDQKVLVLNSLQSISRENVKQGATYLSIMTENLHVLEEALN